MGTPRTLPLVVAALAAACSWNGRDDLAVLRVDPGTVPNHLEVELRIEGRGFDPDVQVDYDRPERSSVDAGLAVALARGAERVPLHGIVCTAPTALRATLAPGAPTGTWDLEVRGPGGSFATLPAAIVIYLAQVSVTTAADEADPGATPWAPGGAGFSLREAVAFVNAEGTPTEIRLSAPLTIAMAGTQTNLTLTAPGAAIVGEPGVALDFAANRQVCVTLSGPGERLEDVALRGCEGTYVKLSSGSTGSQIARVTFEVTTGTRYWAYGVEADAAGGGRIGPGNDLSGLWIGLKVDGPGYEVFGNRIHDNGTGARLAGGRATLWQNVFDRQVKGPSLPGHGLDVGNGAGPVSVLHNVFDANAGSGLLGAATTPLTVRNNLFTANGSFGIDGANAGTAHDHNGYFGNVAGAVSANLVPGDTDVPLDPLYVDASGGDYRLLPGSPALDVGADTGIDLNGDRAGLFNGPAPDLGAFERE